MPDNFSPIFGIENERVTCPFYFKIGACRHGEQCIRLHVKPTVSQTLLLIGLYQAPIEELLDQSGPKDIERKRDFERFVEEVFLDLRVYGEIEDLYIVENLGNHMLGNVYCKYKREESADLAQRSLLGRFFNSRPIIAELSPVTDFREACCRQYEESTCARGPHCNFLHIKAIPRELRLKLWDKQNNPES